MDDTPGFDADFYAAVHALKRLESSRVMHLAHYASLFWDDAKLAQMEAADGVRPPDEPAQRGVLQ